MAITPDNNFLSSLPIQDKFTEALNAANFQSMPEDWYIGVSDIVDSTKAIENDQYKLVNILGVAPIIGILNATNMDAIPYVFGGDGCSFCFPPPLLKDAQQVLDATRTIGEAEYGLELRASIIPVSYIRKQGYDLKITRYRVSEQYVQTIFSGGGLSFAEQVMKDPKTSQFEVPVFAKNSAIDFTGLQCRWQKVKSAEQKEVLTLLVQHNPKLKNSDTIYEKVLHQLQQIYDFDNTNPITTVNLRMHMSVSGLMGETKLQTFGQSWFQRLRYLLKAEIQVMIGKVLMKTGYKTSETDWGLYKQDVVLNTDHRKFDDMLRIVFSSTAAQRKQLQHVLDDEFKRSALAYGLHISDSAMITCMVNRYHRDHIHFVDGSNGGYVEAAKQLKKQMAQLRDNDKM